MGRKFQISFSGGELDPALRDRVDLEKNKSALATGRNVVIGKTGRIVSRPGTKFAASFNGDRVDNDVHLFPFNYGSMVEVGGEDDSGDVYYTKEHLGALTDNYTPETRQLSAISYARKKYLPGMLYNSRSIGSDPSGVGTPNYVLLPTISKKLSRGLTNDVEISEYEISSLPSTFAQFTFTAGSSSNAGTGYVVEYLFTLVVYGQEIFYRNSTGTFNLPITSSTKNVLVVNTGLVAPTDRGYTEVRVYRRPAGAGAFGYIGSSTSYTNPGGYAWKFDDVGQAADYSILPPTMVIENLDGMTFTASEIYQQRLALSFGNRIVFSRTGDNLVFTRSYPYSDDSAILITLRSGIKWMKEKSGLFVFCEDGVYYHRGALSPSNLGFEKLGSWLCDDDLEPLVLSDSILFFDREASVVREVIWEDNSRGVTATEISLFSDHLFSGKTITSWAYKNGELPIIYVSFNDFTGVAFTYIPEHQMRAWTKLDVEFIGVKRFVQGFPLPSTIMTEPTNTRTRLSKDILCIREDGSSAWFDFILDRFPSQKLLANPEYDKTDIIAAMDSIVSWSHLILDDLTNDDMTLAPVTPDEWDGPLTLSVTDDAIFPDPGIGEVGTIFKWFNPDDRTEITLEVTARASNNSITVQPSEEFPSEYATNPRLYECKDTFTGLDHLEGYDVSVVADGYIIASPNNDIEGHPVLTVSSGSVTLPDVYAFVHIGLPFVSDVETLDVTETGQGRGLEYTRLESITCNNVHIRTQDSRGLYVGNRFPANNKLSGSDVTGTNMLELDGFDSYDVNYEEEDPILGNRYDQPKSKLVTVSIPGDWKSRGRVCIRNVDPVHFEITSITSEIDIKEV